MLKKILMKFHFLFQNLHKLMSQMIIAIHLLFTALEACAMKLKNQTSNHSSNTKKSTLGSLNASTRENRTIPFSVEQLIQFQRNDSYAIHILNNIKNYKTYFVKDNILMRRSKLQFLMYHKVIFEKQS